MTRGQIRFDDDLIDIDRAVKIASNAQQTVGLPKKDKVRVAVTCPTLKALLWEHAKDKAPCDYPWPKDDKNEPRLNRNFYRSWKRIIEKVGLPPEMSPHDCRLSHTNMIEKLMPDVSETTLKEHIGHSATGVTQINYTRPITPAQKILRENLERVLGSSKSPKTEESADENG